MAEALRLQVVPAPSCAAELQASCAVRPSFEVQPSAEPRTLVHPAVVPLAVRRKVELLASPAEALRTLAQQASPAERPSLVLQYLELQMLELQELAVQAPLVDAPTANSSGCHWARPRNNRRLHHPRSAAEARHNHPFHQVKQAAEARDLQGSSSAAADTHHRPSPRVPEARTHHLHHPQPEAAALPLLRPRTLRTCCRACPCP